MDKFEYKIKTEQMISFLEQKSYKKAMEIADSIDWSRVKSVSMLCSVSDIYECCGENQKSMEVLTLAYNRTPDSRKLVYRLAILAIKQEQFDQAKDWYETFIKLAPKDPNQYILSYKMLRAQKAPISRQIAILTEFKKADYVEKWAFELARLYHEAGKAEECLQECDDLILWFSEGKYVYKAMELKMKYKPLTPAQQSKYNRRYIDSKKAGQELDEKSPISEEADRMKQKADWVRDEVEQTIPEADAEELESKFRRVTESVELTGDPVLDAQLTGQLRIEEILQDWEAKQREVAKAIRDEKDRAKQKKQKIESKAIREKVQTLSDDIQRLLEDIESGSDPEEEAEAENKGSLVETLAIDLDDVKDAEDGTEGYIEEPAVEVSAADEDDDEELAEESVEIVEETQPEVAFDEAEESEEETEPEEVEETVEEPVFEEAEEPVWEEAEELVLAEAEELVPEEAEEAFALTEESESKETAAEESDDFDEEDTFEEILDEDILIEDDNEPEESEPEEEAADTAGEIHLTLDEAEDLDDEEYSRIEAELVSEEASDGFELGDFDELDEEEEPEVFEEEDIESVDMDLDEETENELDEADAEDFEDDPEDEEEYSGESEEEAVDLASFEEDEEPIDETYEEPIEEFEETNSMIKRSPGGVVLDTGFVVQGRYDLEAQSEIGTRAGLTEEEKKLFSYFVPVRGMSEQIVEVLDADKKCTKRFGTSRTGNLVVVGRKGSGKTVLAVDIVKAIQKNRKLKQGKVAIVTGEALNKKDIFEIFEKLYGGALIIEKAGQLTARTVRKLNEAMEEKTGELLVVLEEQRKPLDRLMKAYPEFKKKFTSRLELPTFINDELVTFGQTYAKENGYRIDDMGILALYGRIDVMQTEGHAVTVAEVKEVVDEAIAHSQKANVKHLMKRVFGKSTDETDRIILKEDDFRF